VEIMSEQASHIALLRQQYEDATDPNIRAALAAAIAALGGTVAPPANQQSIGDNANLAVNVVGNLYGHVFLNGYRERSRAELLAAYLGRLAERCAAMPLQGMYGERDASDSLDLSLDQVYTQLATTNTVAREVYNDLNKFDAEAFLAQHVGDQLLPRQARKHLEVYGSAEGLGDLMSSFHEPSVQSVGVGGGKRISISLEQGITAERLNAQLEQATQITASGTQLVTEAIAQQQYLVLLGEPGGGKSTVLRYLARNLARAGLEQGYDADRVIDGWHGLGRLLPIFAPLLPLARAFANAPQRHGMEADLWNYLVDLLQPKGAYSGLAEAVLDEIEQGQAILLLDGLDEVVGSTTRRQVVEAIVAFARSHKRCRIVVSCRIRAYDAQINPQNKQWQLPGWPVATLADLTPAQMNHFVNAWYRAVAASDEKIAAQAEERIAELQAALRARLDLRKLGVRPLLLTIMALVHLRQRNLPEDRASLYRECVEILLARWELRGKEETEYKALMDYIGLPGLEVKALRPLLAKVALAAHQASTAEQPGLLDGAKLQVMVLEFLHDKQHPNPYGGALRFLEYTDYRAGLIHAASAGSDYQFAHLTFQEYLAGLALVGAEKPVQALLAKRNDERWRLPIFLGIGHAVSEGLPYIFGELLDELIGDPARPPTAQHQRDLILAAELAEDVRWQRLEGASFERRKRELANVLVSVLEGTLLPAAERVRAGVLLGNLGDPRPGVCTLPPAMVEIAGGTFQIGSTVEEAREAGEWYAEYYLVKGDTEAAERARNWPEDEINQQLVSVQTSWLARYPVTNAQYGLFITDNGYDPVANWWDKAGHRWLQSAGGTKRRPRFWSNSSLEVSRLNHPVVGVSWYEAMAFCRWLSQNTGHNPQGFIYTLPSEAEWEYAARGVERRSFPWGNERTDVERANYEGMHEGTTAVGSFPLGATPEGLHALAGDVWEWTRSIYKSYPYDPNNGREDLGDPEGKGFILRGGSWNTQSADLRASYRYYNPPDYDVNDVGFRLARHLKL
jgi:formylglycine-generating enzyme required for sulfatase activity